MGGGELQIGGQKLCQIGAVSAHIRTYDIKQLNPWTAMQSRDKQLAVCLPRWDVAI